MEAINLAIIGAGEIERLFLPGSILLIFIVMIGYFRRIMSALKDPRPGAHPREARVLIEESEAIYGRLEKTIAERKAIAERLIAQLDTKIKILQANLERIDRSLPLLEGEKEDGIVPASPRQARTERNPTEIAKETGLSLGEIELMMNLKRFQHSAPLKV